MFDNSASMGNGSRTHASLIGKYTPGHTGTQRNEKRTYHTAGDGLRAESTLKNCGKCRRDCVCAKYQRKHTQKQIKQSRKGYQMLGDLSDAFRTAQQHCSNQNRQANSHP